MKRYEFGFVDSMLSMLWLVQIGGTTNIQPPPSRLGKNRVGLMVSTGTPGLRKSGGGGGCHPFLGEGLGAIVS